MNVYRVDAFSSLREKRRAEGRSRRSLKVPKASMGMGRRIIALFTAIVFYGFSIAPSAGYLTLEASPVVPQLETPEFSSQDLIPFIEDAASSQNISAWDGILLQGTSILRADWEEEIENQIEAYVNSVQASDQIHDTEEYRTYIRDSLELQKEQALADWIRDAEDAIQEERDLFLSARSRVHLAEQEDETEESQLNWEYLQASYFEDTEQSLQITPDTIPDIFNRASDMLEIEQQAWQRDYQDRLDFGNYEYTRALGQISQEHTSFHQELDEARATFEQNRQYIEDLETQVRNEIQNSVSAMKHELFRSPQFYRDFQAMSSCDQWDSASCEQQRDVAKENLNAAGQNLASQIESLEQSLNRGEPLSDLTRNMRDILEEYKNTAETRSAEWDARIEGTAKYNWNEGGFSRTTSRLRYRKHNKKKMNKYYQDGDYSENSGRNPSEYSSVYAGGGGLTTQLGESDTRLIYNGQVIGDLLDSPDSWNREGINDVNWSELEKRGRIARLLEYHRSGKNGADIANLISGLGDNRAIEGVSFTNICGNGGAEGHAVDTGYDCLTDAGKHSGEHKAEHTFVYGHHKKNNNGYHIYRVSSQTSFNLQVHYQFYDEVAKNNRDTWQVYSEELGSELDVWNETLLPSIENWEAQRRTFEENYAAWLIDAEEKQSAMDAWYESSREQLLSSRDNWRQRMEDQHRQGRNQWFELNRDLRLTERDWQDRVEQTNWRDAQMQVMLRQELNQEMENLFQSVPGRVEAETGVEQEMALVKADMPALQAEFLEQGNEVPDTDVLFDLVEQFSRAATAMMNAASVDGLNEKVDTLRDQALEMAVDLIERNGTVNLGDVTDLCDGFNMCESEFAFDSISVNDGSITAERTILSGKFNKRSGKNGRKNHHYTPEFSSQAIDFFVDRGGSVDLSAPASVLDDRDTGEMLGNFMESMQSFQQGATDALQVLENDLERTNNIASDMVIAYTSGVMGAVENAEYDHKRGQVFTQLAESELVSTVLTVASFIPVTAVFALAAQAVISAGAAMEQGGDLTDMASGMVAGVANHYVSQYTGGAVNINYSAEDGWGGSVGYDLGGVASIGVNYSENGGWGATAGVGVGDFQVGAAWNENSGVNAAMGYTGINNTNLGMTYDDKNGFAGSLDYANDSFNASLAYQEGVGLSGSASYLHENDRGGYHHGQLSFDADGNYDATLDSRFDTAYEMGRFVDADGDKWYSQMFEGAYSNSTIIDTQLGYSSEDGAYFDHDVNLRAATDNRIVANDGRYTTCTVEGVQGVCEIRENGMGPDHSTFQHTNNFMNAKLGCSGSQCDQDIDNFVGLGMTTNIRDTERTCSQMRKENGGTCFGIENTTGINAIGAVSNAIGHDLTGQSNRWANFIGAAQENDHMHEGTTSFFHSDGTSNYLLAAENYHAATGNALDMGGGDIHLAGSPLVNPWLGNSEEKLAERLTDAGVSPGQVNTHVYGDDPISKGITRFFPWRDMPDHSEHNYIDYVLGGGDSENMASSNMGNDPAAHGMVAGAESFVTDSIEEGMTHYAENSLRFFVDSEDPDVQNFISETAASGGESAGNLVRQGWDQGMPVVGNLINDAVKEETTTEDEEGISITEFVHSITSAGQAPEALSGLPEMNIAERYSPDLNNRVASTNIGEIIQRQGQSIIDQQQSQNLQTARGWLNNVQDQVNSAIAKPLDEIEKSVALSAGDFVEEQGERLVAGSIDRLEDYGNKYLYRAVAGDSIDDAIESLNEIPGQLRQDTEEAVADARGSVEDRIQEELQENLWDEAEGKLSFWHEESRVEMPNILP